MWTHLKWTKRDLKNVIAFHYKSSVEYVQKIFDIFKTGTWAVSNQQVSEIFNL